ncbi:hypothetical protein FRC02_012128 [Tulasnella sp. 418]|nr:hypothetical protein FRC02_012128 [Tulasnella sp. 418]
MFAPQGANGQGMITGFSFPYETAKHGILLHTAIDVANPQEYVYIGRIALTTSSGAFQMWQQDKIQWTREESLASIKAVELVDLPEKVVVKSGHKDAEGFVARLGRHSGEIKNLPSYIIRFGKRFLTGSYLSPSTPAALSPSELYRDTFGFRKLIVAVTSTAKVIALDSTTGNEVWGRLLSYHEGGGAPVTGDVKIFSFKSVEEGDGSKAEIVIVARNGTVLDPEDEVKTGVYHLDALTGKTIGKDAIRGVSTPQYELDGTFQDAFLVQSGAEKSVAVVDNLSRVHVYPSSNIQSFTELAPRIHFSLVQGSPGYRRVAGFKVNSSPVAGTNNVFSTYSTWSNSFIAQQESVHALVKSGLKPGTPLASFGKVLGNRDTLYKYINPHLVAVVTTPSTIPATGPQQCGIYLIDSVKGNVVYHAPLSMSQESSRKCGEEVQVSLTENWLVYSYYTDDTSNGKAKGWRMVTVELYEGDRPNEKISSPDLSSYSIDKTRVKVFQQSYVFPRGVVAMASTVTKFGISLKDIIVATDSNQIQAVPRRLLDPRRPKNKPTNEEQEEGLVPFDPILPEDPKRVLSHHHSTARIKSILTTPSQLESTSMIFAHGLDLFQTRVSPSNTFDLLSEDFNRMQLVLTICGLVLAIGITRPLVKAKQLKLKWYPYS